MRRTKPKELLQAQAALLVAIWLQLISNSHFMVGSKYLICMLEVLLVLGIGVFALSSRTFDMHIRRSFSFLLIGLISVVNFASLISVSYALVYDRTVQGTEILATALAIFITNIIVFSIWYWEIDCPALTGYSAHNKKPQFLFPQMTLKHSNEDKWEPTYPDYLYLAVTNSTAFSPTDTLPLTHTAKSLMAVHALLSLLTLVLVAARAVNILGS